MQLTSASSWFSILPVLILARGSAAGAVLHDPIKNGLQLNPSEAYTVTIDATEPTELGWRAVQAVACTTNCVQATEMTSDAKYAVATALGASRKYTPASGKIAVEYKNVSRQPVVINIFRVRRICDAEACAFLDENRKGETLVFKIDEFTSITTSKDQSYSVISGVAESGRRFTFRAIWWTDDRTAAAPNCAPFVTRYLNNHTPKDQYRPYVISGQSVGDDAHLVLRSISTCAPKASHYGAVEKSIYK